MISAGKQRNVLLMAIVALAASALGTGRAQAQWGMGGGFGVGFYGGNLFGTVPQPSTFINQVALAQIARGPSSHPMGNGSHMYYAGNPNSYINHLRDNGFVDRYYPDRREPSYYGYSARPPAQRMTPTAATGARARPMVPLPSFYNAQNQLIWSGDAPTAGDLREKRDASDKACQTVLQEVKQNGVAAIASVTEARQKLLDYGRPALKYVREHETPRVADAFHIFLLSLYDSLAQAAGGT
jgi:hypothetical protein